MPVVRRAGSHVGLFWGMEDLGGRGSGPAGGAFIVRSVPLLSERKLNCRGVQRLQKYPYQCWLRWVLPT